MSVDIFRYLRRKLWSRKHKLMFCPYDYISCRGNYSDMKRLQTFPITVFNYCQHVHCMYNHAIEWNATNCCALLFSSLILALNAILLSVHSRPSWFQWSWTDRKIRMILKVHLQLISNQPRGDVHTFGIIIIGGCQRKCNKFQHYESHNKWVQVPYLLC